MMCYTQRYTHQCFLWVVHLCLNCRDINTFCKRWTTKLTLFSRVQMDKCHEIDILSQLALLSASIHKSKIIHSLKLWTEIQLTGGKSKYLGHAETKLVWWTVHSLCSQQLNFYISSRQRAACTVDSTNKHKHNIPVFTFSLSFPFSRKKKSLLCPYSCCMYITSCEDNCLVASRSFCS